MSQQVTYTCDCCGKVKGEANHWFVCSATDFQLSTFAWNMPMGHPGGAQHLCGEACVLKWVSQNLAGLAK